MYQPYQQYNILVTSMEHISWAYNIKHVTCNREDISYNIEHIIYNIEHIIYNIEHISYNIEHRTYWFYNILAVAKHSLTPPPD